MTRSGCGDDVIGYLCILLVFVFSIYYSGLLPEVRIGYRVRSGRDYIFTDVLCVLYYYVVLSGVGVATILRMGVAIYLYQ